MSTKQVAEIVFGPAVMEGKDDWIDLSTNGGPIMLVSPDLMRWLEDSFVAGAAAGLGAD